MRHLVVLLLLALALDTGLSASPKAKAPASPQPKKAAKPSPGPKKAEAPPAKATEAPAKAQQSDEQEEKPPPAEKPGKGDFLDDFAKQFVGYTVQEIQSSPYESEARMLHLDTNELTTKLNQYINEFVDEDRDSYELLWHTQELLEGLGYRTVSRPEAVTRLRTMWEMLGHIHREKLIKLFPAYKLVDEAK